ncbi:molybdate ABC transporter permease subunit [Vibrio sp. JC009]|uniref:molybdate ABC transporter permease subunit n=1 Tax=Vibrio sp. JC009 TaxID=2912314 RepID=UPI0023B10451|nr:molybdate ABC transporter permease subunit [Vibrio sp. JC009]WED24087.1 molybdate ABC transporter permease subunit [Vibrio sp. JC009]
MLEVDFGVVTTTLKLALVVTTWLLIIGIPVSWWLANSEFRFKGVVVALLTLPMVLPPTVLGFYLLLLMGPNGPVGRLVNQLGMDQLPFSFAGIAIACIVHSIPFVIQPLQNAFEAIGKRPMEIAATLRASPRDTFFSVTLPLAWPGVFSAAVMGFCHTLGEFGVVLMIGGNIPGKTRVVSVEIYNYAEALEYGKAHILAGGMVLFSFIALVAMYWLNSHYKSRLV